LEDVKYAVPKMSGNKEVNKKRFHVKEEEIHEEIMEIYIGRINLSFYA